MRPLLLLLLACSPAEVEPTGCRDDGDCSGLSICGDAGVCEAVECTGSEHCALEQFCDTTAHSCVDGCEVQEDCLSGSYCADDGSCAPSDCTDSQIDCHYGERCNLDIGQCEDNAEVCLSCAGDGYSECRDVLGGTCRWFDGASYCLPPCSPFSDPSKLPRGFDCLDFDSSDEGEEYYLYGDCSEVAAVRGE